MTDKTIRVPKAALDQRGVLKGSAAVGAGAMLANMPITRHAFAQSGQAGTLRVRAYRDLNVLDPDFYQNAYNVDVMNCI
jgi:peptide/nickel transport system substrate-binding protein